MVKPSATFLTLILIYSLFIGHALGVEKSGKKIFFFGNIFLKIFQNFSEMVASASKSEIYIHDVNTLTKTLKIVRIIICAFVHA